MIASDMMKDWSSQGGAKVSVAEQKSLSPANTLLIQELQCRRSTGVLQPFGTRILPMGFPPETSVARLYPSKLVLVSISYLF